MEAAIVEAIDAIRPALQMDGGDIELVGVNEEGGGEDPRPSADETLRQRLLGGVAAIRSWRAYQKGEPHDAIAFARQALALLPENDPYMRTRLRDGPRSEQAGAKLRRGRSDHRGSGLERAVAPGPE